MGPRDEIVICSLHTDYIYKTLAGDFVIRFQDVVDVLDSVSGVACICSFWPAGAFVFYDVR